MKNRLFAFIVAFLITFTFVVVTHAQENSTGSAAQKYGISFPVAELGNCSSLSECREYCEDPLNQEACVNFAKQKGFYKEPTLTARENAILNAAKSELGCESKDSCMQLCHLEENFDKCSDFAQKYNLGGGQTQDPGKAEIIQKAQSVLGCSSHQQCKEFCSQEENRAKCDEFAKSANLKGGEKRVGPGGCTSKETCQAFCSSPDNFAICSQYGSKQGQNFSGPGGCSSEDSCRKYCTDNPERCKFFRQSTGAFSPYPTPHIQMSYQQQEASCKAGGGTCSGPNNSSTFCDCQGYSAPSNSTYSGSSGSYAPCPNIVCAAGYAPDPGYSCSCRPAYPTGSAGSTGTSAYQYTGNTMSYADQEASCKSGGGSCSGPNNSSTFCDCRNYAAPSSSTQYSRESQEAGCTACNGTCNWSGDNCNCQCNFANPYSQSGYAPEPTPTPAVQGVSSESEGGLIQKFLNWLGL